MLDVNNSLRRLTENTIGFILLPTAFGIGKFGKFGALVVAVISVPRCDPVPRKTGAWGLRFTYGITGMSCEIVESLKTT